MEKIKRFAAALLMLTLAVFFFAGCGKKGQRGPLDVKKVTYVVYSGQVNHVEVYYITSDRKVQQYSIDPAAGMSCDYLSGELPSEDCYELKEYEVSELSWSSMVNVLTRVDFMTLDEDLSDTSGILDASTTYIRVETSDSVHTSGGYAAGVSDGSDNRRYSEARQYIYNAIRGGN